MNKQEAKKIATEAPSIFFYNDLHLEYPDLAEAAAKELINKMAHLFFHYKLSDSFPELEELAVEKFYREYTFNQFLRFNLHKRHPKYLLLKFQ